MAQLHLALNKEQRRVQRVLIVADGDPQDLAPVQQRFADLLIVNRPSTPAWNDAFAGQASGLYVVDPLANVMMRYAGPVEMRGVLKDLERLLKYSWIR